MDISKIISIAGKPGLYELLNQSRNGFIVKDLSTGKKKPIASQNNVSLLSNIAIYTYEEEIPLTDVFLSIAEKEGFKASKSHKEDLETLKSFFEEILPDYDKDRVRDSDIKKVFQWYNILEQAGLVVKPQEKEETPEETTSSEE